MMGRFIFNFQIHFTTRLTSYASLSRIYSINIRRYCSRLRLDKIGPGGEDLAIDKETGELCTTSGGRFAIHSFNESLDLIRRIKHSPAFYPNSQMYDFFGKPIKLSLPLGFNLFFRGQAKDYPVAPGIFRIKKICVNGMSYNGHYDEASIFNEFRSTCLSTEEQSRRTVFQHLATMQHYGLPTRLLDWTTKFSIALYFALRNINLLNLDEVDISHEGQPSGFLNDGSIDSKEDAFLYVLDAMRLNMLTKKEGHLGIATPEDLSVHMRAELARLRYGNKKELETSELYNKILENARTDKQESLHANIINSLKLPIAVLPPMIDDRLQAQGACFTIHGGKVFSAEGSPEEEFSLNSLMNYNKLAQKQKELDNQMDNIPILFKIRISGREKYAIKKDLVDNIGINEGILFLDRDSYARSIKQKWQFFSKKHPQEDYNDNQEQKSEMQDTPLLKK